MVELSGSEAPVWLESPNDMPKDLGNYKRAFAGDVANTAIYLKRLLGSKIDLSFLSATGSDPISQDLRTFFDNEKINGQWLLEEPRRQLGLYLIHTDNKGERTFSFWRSESAARHTLGLLDQGKLLDQRWDGFYFSGISIAMTLPELRPELLALVTRLREQGAEIVYDNNYRPALWPDNKTAQQEIEPFLPLINHGFLSNEDEQALWQNETELQQRYPNAKSLVLKRGGDAISVFAGNGHRQDFAVSTVEATDTTAAGDSFNAGYLWGQMNELAIPEAVEAGHQLATQVVQKPGAIVDIDLTEFKNPE